MNLRLIILGTELIRITTDADLEEAAELDDSGYTATTIVGFTQDKPPGWWVPLHEPGWDE